jgi:hypothetical protein
MKIAAVHAVAPSRKEPPFLAAPLVVMEIFAVMNIGIKPMRAPAAGKSS